MLVEMLQITAEQVRRQLFVALELARNFLSPSSSLRHALQDRKRVRARSGQIQSKLNLSKNIENGPRLMAGYTIAKEKK